MKYPKIQNSKNIPDYIVNNLSNPNQERKLALLEEVNSNIKKAYNSGVMDATMFLNNIPNIRHGAGTFESKNDMSIWEVRGDSIYRRKDRTMEVEAVLYALEGSPDEEE